MAADSLVSLAILAAILFLFYGPWQEACTDLTRHIIFVRRDRLFNMAYDGKLSFDSREYKAIRSGLESFIRYAHEMTWQQFTIFFLVRKYSSKAGDSKFFMTDAVELIEDKEARSAARKIVVECSLAMMLMMALKSILTAPLTVLGAAFFVCTKTVGLFTSQIKFAEGLAIRLARSAQEAEQDIRKNEVSPA